MNLFSKNATAVLVHGAWADGSSWNRVILPLLHEGLKVVCAPIPLTSLSDDAAALNRVLERIDGPVLLDQPKDAALHGRADGSEGPGSPCRSHAASHGAPKGREKLESKADLRARGVESPDRADALIGAIVLGQEANFNWQEELEDQKRIKRQMQLGFGSNAMFPRRHISFR
jgi:hypothetical protein